MFVYVISLSDDIDRGPVKVGVSDDPATRLAQLQTGSAVKLHLVETYVGDDRGIALAVERVFHWAHAKQRLEGEWFDVSAYHAWSYLHGLAQGLP